MGKKHLNFTLKWLLKQRLVEIETSNCIAGSRITTYMPPLSFVGNMLVPIENATTFPELSKHNF